MDNELYCPMKMTSNLPGRFVCEKESALGGGSWITAVPYGGLHGSWTTSKQR